MKLSFLDKLANLRAARIDVIDAQEIAPKLRNHLLQLFRAAHAVEPGLTGVDPGMGTACATGAYRYLNDEGTHSEQRATYWNRGANEPLFPEVRAFLDAVKEYSDHLCDDLPYIDDITLDDIKTTRAKKSAVWREINGPSPYVKKRVTRTRRAG